MLITRPWLCPHHKRRNARRNIWWWSTKISSSTRTGKLPGSTAVRNKFLELLKKKRKIKLYCRCPRSCHHQTGCKAKILPTLPDKLTIIVDSCHHQLFNNQQGKWQTFNKAGLQRDHDSYQLLTLCKEALKQQRLTVYSMSTTFDKTEKKRVILQP